MSAGWVVLLSFITYLVGAGVTWRIAYARIYGRIYTSMAKCNVCVGNATRDSNDVGCFQHGHSKRLSAAFNEVAWIVLCWPIVALGLAAFFTIISIAWLGSKLILPRGNRNRGFLMWRRSLDLAAYKKTREDLKRELFRLGIDSKSWLPEEEPADDVSPRKLESEGLVLGRKLEEASAALRQAKEISAMKIRDDQKRAAIEAVLRVAPYEIKANVKPSESRQWHEELRVSGSK